MDRYLDVTHIAVCVPGSLREAEDFYRHLLDLEVSWREPVPDGAPWDLPWDDFQPTDEPPNIVLLHSGALRLAVVAADSPAEPTRRPVDHVGLQVTGDQLRRIRTRAKDANFQVLYEREDEVFDFLDRYGVEWELDTRSFQDPRAIMDQKRARSRANQTLPGTMPAN